MDLHPDGLCNAWYVPVYSEFTSVLPLRFLARHLVRKYAGGLFAIPLGTSQKTALQFWKPNELECLFLAGRLRREGAAVCLVSDDRALRRIDIAMSKAWLRKPFPEFRRNASSSAVMCNYAIRRPGVAAAADGTDTRVRPGLFELPGFLFAKPARLSIALPKGASIGNCRVLSPPQDQVPSLEQGFLTLIAPQTEKVAAWYRAQLGARPVETVHIADHTSFEGGLLAGEVFRKGGAAQLWPHSANVVHLSLHAPRNVAAVTTAARSTADHWVQRFGPERVRVDARAILPDMPPAPDFDAAQPLSVVLFAGAHRLLRMPLMSYRVHAQSWTDTLAALARSGVDCKLKHKSIWETREWIKGRAPDGAELDFTNVKSTKLMLPNMVFVSISLTSTALFEGVARGIPCFTVQETPAIETPYYDPAVIPCIPSSEVEGFLATLRTKPAWTALRDRQAEWFRKETAARP